MTKFKRFILIFLIMLYFNIFAQIQKQDSIISNDLPKLNNMVLNAKILDGDTIPVISLPTIYIISQRTFRSEKERKKYLKLKHNVIKVYPYAKLAGELFRKYQKEYEKIDKKRDKKEFAKKIEKELLNKYGNEIKKLNITQGIILMKLIDRETKNTSYDIIKEFRGGFSAFFWQTIAKIYGTDLKIRYEPEGEDREIENIVQMIENKDL